MWASRASVPNPRRSVGAWLQVLTPPRASTCRTPPPWPSFRRMTERPLAPRKTRPLILLSSHPAHRYTFIGRTSGQHVQESGHCGECSQGCLRSKNSGTPSLSASALCVRLRALPARRGRNAAQASESSLFCCAASADSNRAIATNVPPSVTPAVLPSQPGCQLLRPTAEGRARPSPSPVPCSPACRRSSVPNDPVTAGCCGSPDSRHSPQSPSAAQPPYKLRLECRRERVLGTDDLRHAGEQRTDERVGGSAVGTYGDIVTLGARGLGAS
jgi:hypothetical protein